MPGEQVRGKQVKGRKGAKRGPRGRGTVFFHQGRGVYVGRKPVGRSATGKTLYVEVSAKTQSEAVKALEKRGPPGPETTFAAWARWFDTLTVRPATRHDYRKSVDLHRVPALGHLRVKDVTPSRVEAMIPVLAQKGLNTNTVRKVLSHARILFAAAVRDGIITANPVAIAHKPKKE